MYPDLAAIFRRQAEAPARPFLLLEDGSTLTYADLYRQSGALAHVLSAAGLGRGDRLLVQLEKDPVILALYLACLRMGAIFLPVNPAYTLPETRHFIEDAEPALIVTGPERARALAEAGIAPAERLIVPEGPGGPDGPGGLAGLAGRAADWPGDFADPAHRGDDLAAILYTSGTTGRSKGVMLTRDNLASNAHSLREIWGFGPEDVLIHALPVFHTHGLFVATNCLMIAGGAMIWQARFEPEAVLAALPRATTMMGVPTFYSRLLDHPGLTREASAHMRLFISGSAPLSPATFAAWEQRTGKPILERYGMTETNMITSNPLQGERIAGTVGRPLPGVEMRLTDPATGAALPQTAPSPGNDAPTGRIEVRGPNVFKGYWRLPEKTAAEFTDDGFFVTGDLGALDAQGYLRIMGREKDLVISGGLNVYPAEVEAALDSLPGVAESAVIGLPHPDLGEAVVACIRPQNGDRPDEAELRHALRDRLAPFKIPKRILVLPELPRNAMGKVQKSDLRSRHAGLFSQDP